MLSLLLALSVSFSLYAADPALKDSLKDFKKQTGLREKYLAAIGVQLRSLASGADPSKLFDAAELALFKEARALLDSETTRLKELQQKLTPADIQEITKGNPQSI
jgi:hypothetical protein